MHFAFMFYTIYIIFSINLFFFHQRLFYLSLFSPVRDRRPRRRGRCRPSGTPGTLLPPSGQQLDWLSQVLRFKRRLRILSGWIRLKLPWIFRKLRCLWICWLRPGPPKRWILLCGYFEQIPSPQPGIWKLWCFWIRRFRFFRQWTARWIWRFWFFRQRWLLLSGYLQQILAS